jgi:hypothetical protein
VLKIKTQSFAIWTQFIAENHRYAVSKSQTTVFWFGHSSKILYPCRICVLLRTPKKIKTPFFRRNYLLCRVCVHAKDWSYSVELLLYSGIQYSTMYVYQVQLLVVYSYVYEQFFSFSNVIKTGICHRSFEKDMNVVIEVLKKT